MNIAEILKDCPKGTKLYTLTHGYASLAQVRNDPDYPIIVKITDAALLGLTSDGRFNSNFDGECILFPSKENRDWFTFKAPKKEYDFKPFDKVLVRNDDNGRWEVDLFSHYEDGINHYACFNDWWKQCIPYEGNEHLLNTTNNPN